MKRLPVLFLILFVALSSFATVLNHPVAAPPSNTAQSVPRVDGTLQMAYSKAIGGDNFTYHFQPNGAGYTAANPAHNLTIDVTDRALTISIDDDTWQLSSDQAPTDFTLIDNRVTIHRDGYDEWYVNGPVGLQQGFTLYQSSEIAFDVGGTLTTTASAQSLNLGDSLTFSGLMAYDASSQHVPVEFNLTGNKLVYAYDDADAVYPLTIDPWVQQQKLVASDATTLDSFGSSLAIDGNTALIAVTRDTVCGCNPPDEYWGIVYVFTRSGSTWTEQQKLTASDGFLGDEFGISVALSGNTALIGAVGSESAYVFTRSGNIWTQQQKLTDGAPGENGFGWSVAIYGNTALIGAYFEACPTDTTINHSCGSAYVFKRTDTTWTQQAKITAASPGWGDRFGWSVALDGGTALIGAATDSAPAGYESGSAYVFVRNSGVWTQQAHLTAADPAVSDRFGVTLDLSGNTALIGAYGDDCVAGNDCGSAYVFTRSGSIWTQQTKLTAADAGAGDWFSTALSLSGDSALIGNYSLCSAWSRCRAAYVFVRSGGIWYQQAKLDAPTSPFSSAFGGHVALDGDTALIADTFDSCVSGTLCGAVYAFEFQPAPFSAAAACNGSNLEVTIAVGSGPFNITASAGINMPVNGVNLGTTTINGPERWDNVTVSETSGDFGEINLGTFKCRSAERPVPVSPAHQAHITNSFPLFTWTAISDGNNYRLFVFDDRKPSTRTVDIRQNTGGPTQLTLTQPLAPGRYYWRVRGRQNRIWSLWSIRFTLFIDPPLAAPMSISTTPVPLDAPNIRPTLPHEPTIPPSSNGAPITPTLPAPPNSR